MRHPKTFPSLDLTSLDRVAGGLKLDGIPLSDNVEDRRPQWAGGPVPNDVWQKEQDDIAREAQKEQKNTCDENDPYGDEDASMDDEGASDRDGDLDGDRSEQGNDEGGVTDYGNEGDGGEYGGDGGGDYGGEW